MLSRFKVGGRRRDHAVRAVLSLQCGKIGGVSCLVLRADLVPCTVLLTAHTSAIRQSIRAIYACIQLRCERQDVHIITTYHSTLFVVSLVLASVFEVDPDDDTFPACRMRSIAH